jgi:aspartate aminotransferase
MFAFDPTLALSARGAGADEGAIIRMSGKTRDLRAKGHDVVSLTLGEPDFDTPETIRAAAKSALDDGFTHYAPVAGIPELREAIAEKLRIENGLDHAADDIVVANGTKQAIANAILSVVGPGDEVIILAPYWVSYEATVRLAGGTPIILESTITEDYKVPASRIAGVLNANSKMLILNSPCNPTGVVLSLDELRGIANVVAKHPRLLVMSDEIYEYIVFDGIMHSFGALPGMAARTITLNGFSKGFAMTGWRLGYAAAAQPIAKAMARMQSVVSAGANMFVQKAAVDALKGSRVAVSAMREVYRQRRDLVLAGLRDIDGLHVNDIAGTFYAFPDIGHFLGRKAGNHVIMTSDELCDWLVEKHGVAVVPGSAFGAPSSIRISFATGEAELKKALARLKSAFGQLVEG